MKKHLFYNGSDTVIATSPTNAVKVFEYEIGDIYQDDWEPFEPVPDDDKISIRFEIYQGTVERGNTVIPRSATSKQDGEEIIYTALAKDWAKSNKRQFLCSENY